METEGACHLVKISGNFGLVVNGKRFVGSSQWKIPGKKGKSRKVAPFSRLERSERKFAFHLHISRSLHQFQVQGEKEKKQKQKQKKPERPVRKTKWLPLSLHSGTSAQVFFWAAPSE